MTAPLPLAFGTARARTFASAKEAVHEAHRLVPGLIDYDFKRTPSFYQQTAFADLNGLSLAAFSSCANRLHVGPRPQPVLILTLGGSSRLRVDGRSYQIEPKTSALFIPEGVDTYAECDDRSVVLMHFDLQRLEDTARVVLGELWDRRIADILRNPFEVKLRSGALHHDQRFRELFSLLDAWGEHHALRDFAGLDELFYRAAIMAMLPMSFPRKMGSKAQAS